MLDSIEQFLSFLDKIQGLSAAALVGLTCIVVGYLMRAIKPFPNEGIPVVVILWGAIGMLFLADPRATNMPARIWTVRNLFVGLVIGLLSWFAHKLILSRIENWFIAKYPASNGTTFLKRTTVDKETERDKTPTP